MKGIFCEIGSEELKDMAKKLNITEAEAVNLVSAWKSEMGYNRYPTIDEVKTYRAILAERKEEENKLSTAPKNTIFQPNKESTTYNPSTYLKKVEESEYSQVFRVFGPKERQDIVKQIANTFSDVVTVRLNNRIEQLEEVILNSNSAKEVAEASNMINRYNDPINGRKNFINDDIISDILDEVKSTFSQYTLEDLIDLWGNEELAKNVKYIYDNVVKYFNPLVEEATVYIEDREKVRIVTNKTKKSDGTTTFESISGIVQDEDLNEDNDNNEEGALDVAGNDGFNYKIEKVDPYDTLTTKVKEVLGSIYKVDNTGAPEMNVLGESVYLNPETAHVILLNGLADMTDASDFSIRDDNGEYSFPALEKLAIKYPWVNQLILRLSEEPELISSFYSIYRNNFASVFMYKNGEPLPMNKKLSVESTLRTITRNYENGYTLDDDSIYDNNSKIVKDKVQLGLNIVDKALLDLRSDDVDIEDLVSNISKILNMIGFYTTPYYIQSYLDNNNESTIIQGLDIVKSILNKAKNLNINDHLIQGIYEDYRLLANLLGTVSEVDSSSSFSQKGKTYQSYIAPSYSDTLVGKLRNPDKRQQVIEKEYKSVPFFYQNGKWRFKWMELIESENEVANNLSLKRLNNIDGKEYEAWTPEDIINVCISEYVSLGSSDKLKYNYAWYNSPILADSPTALFIKGVKFTGDFKSKLLPLYRQVVYQEIYRINQINKRKENKIAGIDTFDKNGASFRFFPFLNNLTIDGVPFKDRIFEFVSAKDISGANALINDVIERYLDYRTERLIKITNKDSLHKYIGRYGIKKNEIDKVIEEYVWNHTFATAQIIQLFATDLAYFKDTIAFQKRFKQIIGAGKKLNTNSKYGKEIERYFIAKDEQITSSSFGNIQEILDKAVREGRLNKALKNNVLAKLKDIASTDAQAFRTFPSFRSILDMMGKWNDSLEEAYERIINDTWTMADLFLVIQTVKPFLSTQIVTDDGVGGKLKVPIQNKNSEFALLAIYDILSNYVGKSVKLKALNRFMVNNDIDVVQFKTAVKVGAKQTVDLSYSRMNLSKFISNNPDKWKEIQDAAKKDISEEEFNNMPTYNVFKLGNDNLLTTKDIDQQEYNDRFKAIDFTDEQEVYNILESSVKTPTGEYNYDVVTEVPYSDWGIQQPTDEHVVDREASFGSQFETLIISDLPNDPNFRVRLNGRDYTKQEIVRLYSLIRSEIRLRKFNDVKKELSTIDNVRELVLNQVKGNPKYSRDIVEALELIDIPNTVSGESTRGFKLPLYSPSINNSIQDILISAIRNKVSKLKIKGGNCILVSSFGFTRDLNLVFDDNNNLLGAECLLPATSRQFFEPLLTTKYLPSGEEYQELDITKLPEDLKRAIGYRIPTEAKYSMVPLIIKGFLPQQNGSAAMVAADYVLLSGWDFDVDKLYLMLYEFDENLRKIEFKSKSKDFDDMIKAIKYNSVEALNNLTIDIAYSILTNKDTVEKIIQPGNFDTLEKEAKIVTINTNRDYLAAYMKEYGLTTPEDIIKLQESQTSEDLVEFLKKYSEERDPLSIETFIYFHQQNMAGRALIGIYANNTTIQGKLQQTTFSLKRTQNVEGKSIEGMTNLYDINGRYISQNSAEYSAASVDNAKNPVLSDLMQNPNTAYITSFMLRAGYPIDIISSLFSYPIIRDKYIQMGSLEDLKETVNEILDKFKIGIDPNEVINLRLSKKDLNTTTLEYTLASSQEEIDSILIKSIPVALKMVEIINNALALKMMTPLYKVDTPTGGPQSSAAKFIRQSLSMETSVVIANKNNFPFDGLGSKIDINYTAHDKSMDDFRKKIQESEVPVLQASYTGAFASTPYLLNDYILSFNPTVMNIIREVSINSDYNVLPAKIVNDISNDIIYFALLNTRMFGNDDNISLYDKRNYYLKEFPKKYKDIINSDKTLQEIPTLSRIKVEKGKLILDIGERPSKIVKESITRAFDYLLYLDNPKAQRLAIDLFMYSFYNRSLVFTPNGFGHYFSVNYNLAFPEYVNTLRDLPNILDDVDFVTKFLEQFYLMHNKTRVLYTDSTNYRKEDIIQLSKESSNNINGTPRLYIKDTNGTLYRFQSENYAGNNVYAKIGTISKLGVYSYDPNLSAEEILNNTKETDSNVNFDYEDVDNDLVEPESNETSYSRNEWIQDEMSQMFTELTEFKESFKVDDKYNPEEGEKTLDKPLCK